MNLWIERRSGSDVGSYLTDVAALRGAVFREWPYLYQADDPDYEARYLSAYAESPGSVFVLARDGVNGPVVGVATGIPLRDDAEAFQTPFRNRGIDPADVFYFGESVLDPDYRGHGIGHRFFDEREAHARETGPFRYTAFCAVDRAPDDPRRPPGARSHDAFWSGRGYRRQPDLQCHLSWKELGAEHETDHTLTFWLRETPDR